MFQIKKWIQLFSKLQSQISQCKSRLIHIQFEVEDILINSFEYLEGTIEILVKL